MIKCRVDLATLWNISTCRKMVFQISWPRGIYRLVLLCQQLQYVIPNTLLMVPLFMTAHENTNVPHSDPKSKFIFTRLLEIN